MPGRKFKQTGKDYHYSFNGQEKETELNENITTAMYWEYDSRIGRRWNTDPVLKDDESPYSVMSNNPIWNIDPDGDSDTTVTSLNAGQFTEAMKIAHDEVAKNDKSNTLSYNKKGIERMRSNIEAAVDNYAVTNKLTVQEGLEMQQVATSYFFKFFDVAGWSPNSFYGIADVLYGTDINDEWKIGITNYAINKQSGKWSTFWGLVESSVYTIASAGYVSGRSVGQGPKGAFKSDAQKQIVESKAGVKFTETTIRRYVNPGRTVSSSDLKRAINGKSYADPQGSGASAYYTTILRNGKSYNLKVVYNEETNTIFHFHYSRSAMGPLPKIPK